MQSILIDDSDTSYMTYTGSWVLGGTSNEYNMTGHGSDTAGSTVTFTFSGSSVQVFGTIGSSSADGTPSTTYVLDSLPPVIYIAATSPSNTLYRQPFYSSPNITNGKHKLTVTVQTGGRYWLDYCLFTLPDAPSGTSTITSSTGLDPQDTSQVSEPSSSKMVPIDTSSSLTVDPPVSSSSTTVLASDSTSSLPAIESQVSSSLSPATIAPRVSSSSTTVSIETSEPSSPAASTPIGQSSDARPTSSSPSILISLSVLGTVIIFIVLVGAWFTWRRRRARKTESSGALQDLKHMSTASHYSSTSNNYTPPILQSRRSSARATTPSLAAVPLPNTAGHTVRDREEQRTLLQTHHADGVICIDSRSGVSYLSQDLNLSEDSPPAYDIHRLNSVLILSDELTTVSDIQRPISDAESRS